MLVKAIQKFPSLKDLIPSLNQNKIYIYPNLNGIGSVTYTHLRAH